MKQKIFTTSILLLFSVLVITALYFRSENFIKDSSHFNRKIHPRTVEIRSTIDIGYNSYYIAGVTSNCVYLGNEIMPLSLLAINTALPKVLKITITNLGTKDIRSGRLLVDSPYFYLADRINQTKFIGVVDNFKVIKVIHDSLASDLYQPMGNNLIAIRVFRNHGLDYTLAKESISPHTVMITSDILEREKDGIFSNDGMFDFDRTGNKLVYVYYYRNQFITIDTNLILLFRAKTIDTTNNPALKTVMIKSDNTFTLAEPPKIVNHSSYSYNNNLLIHSTLKADNEKMGLFKRSCVIDVYDLERKGIYKYSFYLPKYNGKKLKNFAIHNEYFAAIFDRYLIIYNHNFK